MSYFFYLGKLDKDIDEFKKEISEKMTRSGIKQEREALGYILSDLNKLIGKRELSYQLKMVYVNLLRRIINLWAIGKMQSENETVERFHITLKDINPKYDPRANALFHQADIVYQISNERAGKVRKFLEKYHGDKITFRCKEVRLRKGIDSSLNFTVKNARSMSYTEALKEANRKTFFRGHIISPEEFDKREIELQNAYKNFRSREKNKKKMQKK